jgi:hypothetical protein
VSSFLEVVENSLSQPRANYRNATPLDFRDPFVFCVFPGALCGDGKNGEFQTVVPRLTLLGVGSNKSSTASALLEGKSNLMRMRQEIPLNESESAALDDGLSALESLLSRLANIPTPAGPTPLQLRGAALVQIEAAD